MPNKNTRLIILLVIVIWLAMLLTIVEAPPVLVTVCIAAFAIGGPVLVFYRLPRAVRRYLWQMGINRQCGKGSA